MKANRTVTIETRAKSGDTIDIAISSEEPVERFFGIEVLRHTAEAVDLSRLSDGRHPLLLGHSLDRQIGVIDRAWVDDDRVLRGTARFSRAESAQEILRDVEDGIRSLVSVGYEIMEVEEQDGKKRTLTGEEFSREMREQYGENFYRAGMAAARAKGSTPPTFIVTRWLPFEASLVPVPADASVGVGRSGSDLSVSAEGTRSAPEVKASGAEMAGGPVPAEGNRSIQPIRSIPMTTESKKPEELEAERRNAILALGEQYEKYLATKDVHDALRNGRTVEQFKDLIIDKMQTRHIDTSPLQIGLTSREVKVYSFGRALQAAVTGDWSKAGFEQECSRAMEKLIGRAPEGFYVPFDIFRRDFNVGTSTEAGNLVPTELRTDMYVDALRNRTVLGALGVRILAGLTSNVDMPRKSTASTLAMVTEIGSASETNPLTAKVTLSPKRISAFVETSKQAIIQAALPLEAMIRDDLLMGSAVLLENQAINGSGTSPNMTGLRNVTGIGTVVGGTNGAAPAWSHVVDLESACANANAEPDRLAGYVSNTKVRGKLKQTQFATNLPFIWQNGEFPLNGYRAAITNNLPSNLTKGTSTTVCSSAIFGSDWSMAVIGLFGGPDVTVDPYTKADTGQVKITLNQFADFGVRQPAAFAKIDDLLAG